MYTHACHWISIGKWRTSRYSRCVTNENKNTCVGLDTEFGAFDCSVIYEKGNKTVPIGTQQVWYWCKLIHLTSRLRLQCSGLIEILVFVYNCIKAVNRLASEQYFLTLEIKLNWISTSQTELSIDSSRWRSSRRIAPWTNQASSFKNQQINSRNLSRSKLYF
jgi:hypothetical protein